MLTKYHRRSGLEGLMYRKYKDKLAQINNGAINKQVFFPKCIFTEGGVKCGLRVIPCTKYCQKHILEDKKQVLYRACKVEKSNVVCHEPNICIGEETNCLLHWVIPPKRQYSQKKNDSETDDETETQKLQREVDAIMSVTHETEVQSEDPHANVDTDITDLDDSNRSLHTSTPAYLEGEGTRRSQRMSRRNARKPLRSSVRRRTTATQSPVIVKQEDATKTKVENISNVTTDTALPYKVVTISNVDENKELSNKTGITAAITTTEIPKTPIITTISTTMTSPAPTVATIETPVAKNVVGLKLTANKTVVDKTKTTFMLPPKIIKIPLQQSDEEQSTQSRVREILAKRERQLKQQLEQQAQPQPQQQIKVQQIQQTLPQKLQIAPRPMPAIEQKSQTTTLVQPQTQQPQVIKLAQGSFKFAYIRPIISGGRAIATNFATPTTQSLVATTIITPLTTIMTTTTTTAPATTTKTMKIVTTSSNLYLFPGLPKSTSVTINKLLMQTTTNNLATTSTLTTTSASGISIGLKHKIVDVDESMLQIKRKNMTPTISTATATTLTPTSTTPTTTKSAELSTMFPNFIVHTLNKNDEIVAAAGGTPQLPKQLQRLKLKNSLEIQPKITTISTSSIPTVSVASPIISTIRKVQNLNSIKLLRKTNNNDTPITIVSTATNNTPTLTTRGNAKSFRLRNVTITPTWGTNLNLNNNNSNSDNNNSNNNNNSSIVKSSSSATVKVSAAAAATDTKIITTTLQAYPTISTGIATAVATTITTTIGEKKFITSLAATQRPQMIATTASKIITVTTTTGAALTTNKEAVNVGTKLHLDATQFRYLTKYNTVVRATTKPKTIVSNILTNSKTTTIATTTITTTATTATAITTTTATTSTTSTPRIQIIKLPYKNPNLLQ